MLEFSTWSPSLTLGTKVVGAVMQQQQQQVARRETYDRGRKARDELCSLSLSLSSGRPYFAGKGGQLPIDTLQ